MEHTLYLSGSSGVIGLFRHILFEMLSRVLIFLGFHHVLLDATLGNIPYMSGPSRGDLFVQTVLIEDMSLVMTFLCFIMFKLNVIVGHTP